MLFGTTYQAITVSLTTNEGAFVMKLTNIHKIVHSVLLCSLLGVLGVMFSPPAVHGQQPVVIHGYYGEDGNGTSNPASNQFPSPITSYHWNYNYPNNYAYIYGFYWGGYYFYTKAYSEFIVNVNDLRAAGLCAGPIDQLGIKFVLNGRQLNANMKIYMQNTTLSTLGSISDTYRGFPWYYFRNVSRSGNNILPHRNAQFVADVNYAVPVIRYEGNNYQTDGGAQLNEFGEWIDYDFNRSTFVWDGNSNIIVGMYYCHANPNSYSYSWPPPTYLLTHVRPPVPSSWFSTNNSVWRIGIGYYYSGGCSQLNTYTNPYMYSYSWQNYQSRTG
jgi:hypothetical protein